MGIACYKIVRIASISVGSLCWVAASFCTAHHHPAAFDPQGELQQDTVPAMLLRRALFLDSAFETLIRFDGATPVLWKSQSLQQGDFYPSVGPIMREKNYLGLNEKQIDALMELERDTIAQWKSVAPRVVTSSPEMGKADSRHVLQDAQEAISDPVSGQWENILLPEQLFSLHVYLLHVEFLKNGAVNVLSPAHPIGHSLRITKSQKESIEHKLRNFHSTSLQSEYETGRLDSPERFSQRYVEALRLIGGELTDDQRRALRLDEMIELIERGNLTRVVMLKECCPWGDQLFRVVSAPADTDR